jgi:hypothetical protein
MVDSAYVLAYRNQLSDLPERYQRLNVRATPMMDLIDAIRMVVGLRPGQFAVGEQPSRRGKSAPILATLRLPESRCFGAIRCRFGKHHLPKWIALRSLTECDHLPHEGTNRYVLRGMSLGIPSPIGARRRRASKIDST